MTKQNNKGFSLVELITVVAIVVIAAGITGGAISSAYHARSVKAARTVDGMIAQSKINALSGKKNEVRLFYSEDDGCYKCGLYLKGATTPYEEQDVGNSKLEVTAGGISLRDSGLIMKLEYNMDTGRVKSMTVGDTVLLGGGSTATQSVIALSFYGTHTITVYKATGEHVFE